MVAENKRLSVIPKCMTLHGIPLASYKVSSHHADEESVSRSLAGLGILYSLPEQILSVPQPSFLRKIPAPEHHESSTLIHQNRAYPKYRRNRCAIVIWSWGLGISRLTGLTCSFPIAKSRRRKHHVEVRLLDARPGTLNGCTR